MRDIAYIPWCCLLLDWHMLYSIYVCILYGYVSILYLREHMHVRVQSSTTLLYWCIPVQLGTNVAINGLHCSCIAHQRYAVYVVLTHFKADHNKLCLDITAQALPVWWTLSRSVLAQIPCRCLDTMSVVIVVVMASQHARMLPVTTAYGASRNLHLRIRIPSTPSTLQ